jgi:hypothetical protein
MNDYYPIIVGGLLLCTAYKLGSVRPYDWITSPAQKQSEMPGNKDIHINYQPSIHAFTNVENPRRFVNSRHFQVKANRLNGTISTHPQIRQNAVREIVRHNARTGSNNWGLSSPYTTKN